MNRTTRTVILAGVILAVLFFSFKYFIPELFFILKRILIIVLPFITAVLLALLLDPVVNLLEQKSRLNRTLASGITVFIFFGGLGTLATLGILRLVQELSDLSVSLPRYAVPVQEFLTSTFERSRIFYLGLPVEITGRLNETLGTITQSLSYIAGLLANMLIRQASGVPGIIVAIIVTILATYFFSRDRKTVVDFWLKTVPEPWAERSLSIIREIAQAFLNYVRAQSMLITLTTVQTIVGLYLIGANYALTIGIVVGILDLIPVLGPATLFIPWAVWSFITGNMALGIKLLVLYALIWAVRQFLEARVVAANLGLHPLGVLVAMYVGLRLFGVVGLLLGPITLIGIKAVFKYIKNQ